MFLKWLSKCLLLYLSSSNSTENEGGIKLEINLFFTGPGFQLSKHSATLQLPLDFYTGKSNVNLLHETKYNISILCKEELKYLVICFILIEVIHWINCYINCCIAVMILYHRIINGWGWRSIGRSSSPTLLLKQVHLEHWSTADIHAGN